MKQPYAIHWFRRDLRVWGNPALHEALKLCPGRVLGIFCFDHAFLSRPDFSANRFQLFLHSLVELKKDMRALGGDLLVLDVGPEDVFKKLIGDFKKKGISLPKVVTWNRDYEPFARKRDRACTELFYDAGIQVCTESDHLLIEPGEVSKGSGGIEGYQVFTPFGRKWLEVFQSDDVQRRVAFQKKGLTALRKYVSGDYEKMFSLTWKRFLQGKLNYEDKLDAYVKKNKKNVTVEIPEAGSTRAFKALTDFKKRIDQYGERRDYPSIAGTSRLSIYFKNGSLTPAQVIAYFNLQPYEQKDKTGKEFFFNELVWREFYYHVLFRHPRAESESYIPKYKQIRWENNKDWFEAWKRGETGFPIVDAGMRQLKQTGWMHNRVRMIVASFLTKDMLIDWRWGERYFMEQLLDGDLAPNNGGWQWAASTGCDPQPYFRIFNPWLQSKRFDPEGAYIKEFVPELKKVPAKKLHAPIIGVSGYPEPLLDHAEQRPKALALYKI